MIYISSFFKSYMGYCKLQNSAKHNLKSTIAWN